MANTIESIDCPTATFCLAGDANGNVLASNSPATSPWIVTNIAGATAVTEVSCPAVTLCLAISGTSVFWSTDPADPLPAWNSTSIAPTSLESLDCPSTTLCLAGTRSGGKVYSTTAPAVGTSWSAATVVDATRGIFSLNCPTTTFCVIGSDNTTNGPGVYITNNPTTAVGADWALTDNFDIGADGGSVIEGMSCASVSFCVGSDDFGNVLPSANPTGGSAAWAELHLANFPVYWNIACPTTTLCVTAAGGTVNSSVDPTAGVAAWQTDTVGAGLDAVSCASAAFCVVGGSGGNIYVGRQATLTITRAGSGNGTVTGPGFTCPPTCSLVYPIGTLVTAFGNPAADGSTFAGWSGDCTGTGDCSLTMSSDHAVTATFDPAPAATTASTPPDGTPPVVPAADLPPPVEKQTANAYPESGKVLVQQAGTNKFVPLTRPQQVKFGAVFDTTQGVVRITIANGNGGFDTATFSEGKFRLVAAGSVAELDLVGGNFKGCPKAAKGGAARSSGSTRGRNVRHLWGEGKGAFRTKGRFASATIRGTKWLTDDYCRGTLVKVAIGAVTVRDLVKRKSVVLKAPKTYFAQAPG